MSISDQIIDRYIDRAFVKAGEILLRHADAISFLQDCLASGVRVLGMDIWVEHDGVPVEINSTGSGGAELLLGFIRGGLPYGATWVSFVLEAEERR